MSSMPPPPPPPPPPGGMPPSAPPGYVPYQQNAGRAYASFGARFAAMFLDGIVVLLISLPFDLAGWFALRQALKNCFSITVGNSTDIECPNGALNGGWLAAAIALFVVGAVVGTVVYCKKVAGGQSWGHKALGIRIIDSRTGSSISAGRVFGRQICRIFSGFLCYLGYFWMLWDKDKQTWHDKMVNTVVVKA